MGMLLLQCQKNIFQKTEKICAEALEAWSKPAYKLPPKGYIRWVMLRAQWHKYRIKLPIIRVEG